MENSKRQNFIVAISYFLIVIVLCLPIIFSKDLPFSQDWGWPLFNSKYYFWNILTQFNGDLTSVSIKNGLLLLALLGYIVRSPSIFFIIFIFAVHFIAAYSFFRLCKKFTSNPVAFIAGLVYSFIPYVFIRTIMGFAFSLTAYAILPIFIQLYFFKKDKKYYHYLLLGFLLSLIFAQIQAGLLVVLVMSSTLLISLFNRNIIQALKNFIFTLVSFLLVNLPWIVIQLSNHNDSSVPAGGSVTTLSRMATMPHTFRKIFMTSDFQFTDSFFSMLSNNKLFLFGWLIVWFVVFCSIFNKKNRSIVWAFVISSLAVLPLFKGPSGIFGKVYLFVFNHFPQIMVFRDTYHFEFLYAITLCILFSFGLDFLWEKIDGFKSAVSSQQSADKKGNKTANRKLQTVNLLKLSMKALTAGSAIVIIVPYLTFDYAGYSPLRQIPPDYNNLYNYFQSNKEVCHKIYYPPGMDFVYFKDDNLPGASNSDSLAISLGVPFVNGGTSILNTPSEEMFYQNELVSQFYEKTDNGEFVGLLNDGGVDCVVVRQDMDTKYDQAMNLRLEINETILSKWNQTDWLSMIKSKNGMKLEKQFGDNIYIYKISKSEFPISNQNINEKITKTGKSAIEQFTSADNLQLTTYNLPLTDWANVNSYYKNGWSRGRYDFWRKHLFTQLRQDFIYTDMKDSVLDGKIDKSGEYELWERSLVGGTQGSYQLSVNSYQYMVNKDQGEEKFVWKKIGEVGLSGQTNIEIKNISGENAIADIVLVSK